VKRSIVPCAGCGLCESVFPDRVVMAEDPEGFLRPMVTAPVDRAMLERMCPLRSSNAEYAPTMWGRCESVLVGSAADATVRRRGSSGGVTTAVLLYLLESGRVDAVVQVGADLDDPLKNRVYVNASAEEVLRCAGSRYAPSAPLVGLPALLGDGRRYAFVGKPCDVRALRNYLAAREDLRSEVPFTLSFFCAGVPSYRATERVVEALGLRPAEVSEFTYRGNGWPGPTTARSVGGEVRTMSYDESWGGILGQYVQSCCRWCADGVGEFADIASGDAWFLTPGGVPDFAERDGRNVVLVRSAAASAVIEEMRAQGLLALSDFGADTASLRAMQPYQFTRRGTMLGKVVGLRITGAWAPKYRPQTLLAWARQAGWRANLRSLVGTVVRRLRGRL